jgi:DNA-binding CsgD family transcriptional regulator
MKNFHATYDQYLGLIAASSPHRFKKKSSLIIERFLHQQHFSYHFAPLVFMIDYTTKKYIYIDEVCIQSIGHPANYYYEQGLEGYLKQVNSSDFTIINEKIFPKNFEFLRSIHPAEFPELVFSHDYRVKNPAGEWITMLQRYSYISDTISGLPVGVIGVAFNITHFKSNTCMIHTIEKTSKQNNELITELLYKKIFPMEEVTSFDSLSNREVAILKMIAKGYSSKQIAFNMGISINTVNNHRKNMLHKMNCKTASELVKQANKLGSL